MTHAGHFSRQEAIYHGKPCIAFPMFDPLQVHYINTNISLFNDILMKYRHWKLAYNVNINNAIIYIVLSLFFIRSKVKFVIFILSIHCLRLPIIMYQLKNYQAIRK